MKRACSTDGSLAFHVALGDDQEGCCGVLGCVHWLGCRGGQAGGAGAATGWPQAPHQPLGPIAAEPQFTQVMTRQSTGNPGT
ncbi:hypothetical protein Abr02nite_64320 [Paractinoplanes brasiliensis]|nr:hypothetical protein Abr02nite_64320 [Actinoplanes brasiliensis]